MANWEFRGAAGFEAWARERPWLNGGGLCVLRLRTTGAGDMLHGPICGLVRAAHGDERRLSIQRVECGAGHGSPMQALLASIELRPDLNPFEAKDLLGVRFLDRPTVFVLSESSAVATRAWTELAMLVDHFGKRIPGVPLCVIALDGRNALQHDPSFDFTAGRCTELLLAGALGRDEASVWRAYLHHRCCWEAGGDPLLAQEWGDALSRCALGDDAAVESALNDCVREVARAVGLQEQLATIRQALDRHSPDRGLAHQQLNEQRVLWHPPGIQRLELTPWASRALLVRLDLPRELVARLRHNLVCMPLASEILAHCMNAEARIRMQLEGRQVQAADEKAVKAFDRFRRGESSAVVYPAGHPCPPTQAQDVWHFAGLGETMYACHRDSISESLWETVHLRNAMAHGHYVAWAHIKSALRQARRFDV